MKNFAKKNRRFGIRENMSRTRYKSDPTTRFETTNPSFREFFKVVSFQFWVNLSKAV